jgi:hypothetical protein
MKNKYKKSGTVFNQLGFKNINDYFKSDLWMTVRKLYLEKKNNKCGSCGDVADNIFIKLYSIDVLVGKNHFGTRGFCNKCFKDAQILRAKKDNKYRWKPASHPIT